MRPELLNIHPCRRNQGQDMRVWRPRGRLLLHRPLETESAASQLEIETGGPQAAVSASDDSSSEIPTEAEEPAAVVLDAAASTVDAAQPESRGVDAGQRQRSRLAEAADLAVRSPCVVQAPAP